MKLSPYFSSPSSLYFRLDIVLLQKLTLRIYIFTSALSELKSSRVMKQISLPTDLESTHKCSDHTRWQTLRSQTKTSNSATRKRCRERSALHHISAPRTDDRSIWVSTGSQTPTGTTMKEKSVPDSVMCV